MSTKIKGCLLHPNTNIVIKGSTINTLENSKDKYSEGSDMNIENLKECKNLPNLLVLYL